MITDASALQKSKYLLLSTSHILQLFALLVYNGETPNGKTLILLLNVSEPKGISLLDFLKNFFEFVNLSIIHFILQKYNN